MAFACPDANCGKTFGTLQGVNAHARDAHGIVKTVSCPACSKKFKTKAGMHAHGQTVHGQSNQAGESSRPANDAAAGRRSLTADMLRHPVSSPGYWTPRDEFEGAKSFGAFQCGRTRPGCEPFWISAHAQPKYTQQCKACRAKCHAKYLWVNLITGDRRHREDDDRVKKPHLQYLCQACHLGVCTAQGGVYYDRY